MWILWMIPIFVIPVIALGLYGWWNNKQVDKYEAEQRQKTTQGTMAAI